MKQDPPVYFAAVPYQSDAATGLVTYNYRPDHRPDAAEIEAVALSPTRQETDKKQVSRFAWLLEVVICKPTLFGFGIDFNSVLRRLFHR